jgi:hypothetical protein
MMRLSTPFDSGAGILYPPVLQHLPLILPRSWI